MTMDMTHRTVETGREDDESRDEAEVSALSEADPGAAPRKPRVALMGEFSAGKSTLSNLLLGAAPLPTRVTATRLPPVWISHGAPRAVQIGHDGAETPFDLAEIDRVDLDETRLIRLSMDCEMLELCDLIDMPGISDPNMSAEVWQSVFDEADMVIWCTHATQAWRQSEAATWAQIRGGTSGDNLLLITQFDKIANPRDRGRVLARVRRETEGQFAAIYPVALLDALHAGEDAEIWAESGARAFTEHLIDLLLGTPHRPAGAAKPASGSAAERPEAAVSVAAADAARIVPKRVRAGAGGRSRRRAEEMGEEAFP